MPGGGRIVGKHAFISRAEVRCDGGCGSSSRYPTFCISSYPIRLYNPRLNGWGKTKDAGGGIAPRVCDEPCLFNLFSVKLWEPVDCLYLGVHVLRIIISLIG